MKQRWSWFRDHVKMALAPISLLLAFVAGVFTTAVFMLFWGATKDTAPALIGFVSTALGGAIAAGTNLLTSRASRQAQIFTATWPKRLEAHQTAFELWERFTSLTMDDTDKAKAALRETQEWWTKNNFYLGTRSRDALSKMLVTMSFLFEGPDYKNKVVAKAWSADARQVSKILSEDAGIRLSDELLEQVTKKRST